MRRLVVFGFLILFAGCASKDQIAKTLREDPSILYDVIKKDPQGFMNAIREAAQNEQRQAYEIRDKKEKENREKDFNKPREIAIDTKRIIYGDEKAPITVVKYADFQCPACRMGFTSLEEIKKKYPGKIRFIHKNIPLTNIHPQAQLAAEIFESLVQTDKKKALAFYKKAYSEQGAWRSEKALWDIAKSIGANKKAVEEQIKKGKVDEVINADLKEHGDQGFEGTPAYIINGVAMYGAQSVDDFSRVIDRLLKK